MEYLYTKQQVMVLLSRWNVKASAPTKNKPLCFSIKGADCQAKIEWLDKPKSTYGQRLYKLTFTDNDA